MIRHRCLALLAPAIAAGLVLSGCSTVPDEPAPEAPLTGTSAPSTPSASPTSAPAEGGTAVGYEDVLAAIALAEAEVGGPALELDDADGGTWEIRVASGEDEMEVHVSADGTTVLSVERESSLDSDDAAALDRAEVSLGEAVQIAVAEYGGTAPIDQVDLSDERSDTPIWDVEFTDDVEVHVSILDGAVLHVER